MLGLAGQQSGRSAYVNSELDSVRLLGSDVTRRNLEFSSWLLRSCDVIHKK